MASATRQSYVTVSVDDGHPSDLRTAELLDAFGLKATFYVPAMNPERPVLPAAQIRRLAQRFEIGGHTMNHRCLTRLRWKDARHEVFDGKDWLESLTGGPALSFCYPLGRFNARVATLVAEAGFRGARTCQFNLCTWPRDPFVWGVTTQAYSHGIGVQVRHALREGNVRGLVNLFSVHGAARDWASHFLQGLDYVRVNGGIAHLYLHSWEIEERQEWDKLRSVFEAIQQRHTLIPVTNGELFELWRVHRAAQDIRQAAPGASRARVEPPG